MALSTRPASQVRLLLSFRANLYNIGEKDVRIREDVALDVDIHLNFGHSGWYPVRLESHANSTQTNVVSNILFHITSEKVPRNCMNWSATENVP